jgi:hypothetical protein
MHLTLRHPPLTRHCRRSHKHAQYRHCMNTGPVVRIPARYIQFSADVLPANTILLKQVVSYERRIPGILTQRWSQRLEIAFSSASQTVAVPHAPASPLGPPQDVLQRARAPGDCVIQPPLRDRCSVASFAAAELGGQRSLIWLRV